MKLSQLAVAFVLSSPPNVSSVIPNITTKNDVDKYAAVTEREGGLSRGFLDAINEVYESYFKELNDESIAETARFKEAIDGPRSKGFN